MSKEFTSLLTNKKLNDEKNPPFQTYSENSNSINKHTSAIIFIPLPLFLFRTDCVNFDVEPDMQRIGFRELIHDGNYSKGQETVKLINMNTSEECELKAISFIVLSCQRFLPETLQGYVYSLI